MLLDARFPEAVVVRDLSWGLVGTTVLEFLHAGHRLVVKAGDAVDLCIEREIAAHRGTWLAGWVARARAPRLVWADAAAKMLVTGYLPGELVEGTAAEADPAIHRQAGALLAELHAQDERLDEDFEAQAQRKALWWLAQPHRIDPVSVQRLRRRVQGWPTPPILVVPTHGDWQPRNWLVDGSTVRVIDFGRTQMRPGFTDLVRLDSTYRRDRDLAEAFFDGYGQSAPASAAWRREQVRSAISTAVWAHRVGSPAFEQVGLRLIAEVLSAPGPDDAVGELE